MPRIDNIQFRRGAAAAWTSVNPTLDAGEPGFETDTGKVKVGDGATAWNTLEYLVGEGGSGTPDNGTVTTAKIAASTLVTFAETIAANSNDTTIPTTAAVKAYADSVAAADGSLTVAKFNPSAIVTSGETFDGTVTDTQLPSAKTLYDQFVTLYDDYTTQLTGKAPKASPTFTGTVSGVTKSHVGLGNVDNTADTAKPVSTAQQTAIDTSLASATGRAIAFAIALG